MFEAGAASLPAIWIEATADAATALASINYKLETSLDATNWADAATHNADGTSTDKVDQTFAVVAGATANGWLQTTRHRLSNCARIVARGTGGVTKAGDVANATVKAW